MAKLDKNSLGYLGLDFQYQLAKFFVEDTKFFEDMASIVDPNAFTDNNLRLFIGKLKEYYSNEGVVPTYSTMSVVLKSNAKTEIACEEYDALIKKLKLETSFEGCNIIKDTAIKFFKQQNLVRVANKILDIAGKGDIDRYEECQKLLEEASMVGHEDDFGFNIYEMMDRALAKDYTVSIPTGVIQLDEVLGGGLDKGKLGLIIAPAGFGKTSFTTAIASYASTFRCDINNHLGFKVLQIFFEDDDVDITRKHYSRLTKQEARTFKRLDSANRTSIAEWLNNFEDKETLKENLRLKHFKTGEKSASDIEIYIKRLINSGFKPDLVIIDYFECIASEKGGQSSDTEWTKEGVTIRKLENIAHDLNCAIWVPTQGTKDSMNSPEIVRMDQASGSAKKVHAAQLIISIARGLDDIDNSRATITILKNRSGKSGKAFRNIKFDNGTSTISCDEVEDVDDTLAWREEMRNVEENRRNEMTRRILQEQRRNTENSDV